MPITKITAKQDGITVPLAGGTSGRVLAEGQSVDADQLRPSFVEYLEAGEHGLEDYLEIESDGKSAGSKKGDEPFDPSKASVKDTVAHLKSLDPDDDADEIERVFEAERKGKARPGVLALESEILGDGDGDDEDRGDAPDPDQVAK